MLFNAAGRPPLTPPWSCPLTGGDPAFDEAVCWVVDAGIATGYADGSFHAQRSVTRAQLVQWLHRFSGSAAPSAQPGHGFVDVRPGADEAVTWATQNLLVTGYAGHRFRPDASVTRAQAARMLWYLVGTPEAWAHPQDAVRSALFSEG
jgi:hypothetical protein